MFSGYDEAKEKWVPKNKNIKKLIKYIEELYLQNSFANGLYMDEEKKFLKLVAKVKKEIE